VDWVDWVGDNTTLDGVDAGKRTVPGVRLAAVNDRRLRDHPVWLTINEAVCTSSPPTQDHVSARSWRVFLVGYGGFTGRLRGEVNGACTEMNGASMDIQTIGMDLVIS
jgi:hypothetical protein